MLAAEGITKSYDDKTVLDKVTLRAAAGEIVALLGPNGAGKTTLLSIIAGLRRADDGTVEIAGHDLTSDRMAAIANIAIAPQETGVQLLLTARENLEFYGTLAGLSRSEVGAQIDRVADGLDLGAFIDQTTSTLSGGQRRRVHAACAIVARPRLLLLDEPTVGADLEMRAHLLDVVRAVADEGTTVIYTTHYLPEVEALNARVVLLDVGRILVDAPLTSLLEEHAGAAVELRFEGPVPEIALDGLRLTAAGDVLRAEGPGVTSRTAELLASIGDDVQRLREVEVLAADLDSVYLALTGERYRSDDTVQVAP